MSEAITRRNFFRREIHPLRKAVADAIAKADPIKLLELGAPGDEYQPEVDTIIRRLTSDTSKDDVRTLIHEVFASRFGDDLAGIPERYEETAAAIWAALRPPRRPA
jgi:hypothetical protein